MQDFEKAALLAPCRGEWQRGGEHECKMTVTCGLYSLVVGFPWCQGKEMERWLVEALHMWPHPKAPVSETEYDYPNYRNKTYSDLMGAKNDINKVLSDNAVNDMLSEMGTK